MTATTTMTRLIPLADRLVVVPAEPDAVTASGIVIPDTAQDRPNRGTVVAVGPGKRSEKTGQLLTIEINPGEVVVYTRFAGIEVTIDGQDLLVVSADDVLAIMRNVPQS